MNKLFWILEQLKTAPAVQIDEYWRNKCQKFEGTKEELMKLFEEIYNTNDFETSKFIRTFVNPKFTRRYL